MKRFNSSKVRPLGNLQPTSEKQKRYLRKARGIRKPFASDAEPLAVKTIREFDGPVKATWTPPRRRGANMCRLSDAKREAINAARQAHNARRAAFFASLEQHRHE